MARPAYRLTGIILAILAILLPPPALANPVLVGYFPAFKGLERQLETTSIVHYTHINIAFANPDAGARMVHGESMACMADGAGGQVSLAALRTTAARLRAEGARVLLSVAGGVIPACAGDWRVLLAPAGRDGVVKELLAVTEAAGLDGIDVDIEGELLTAIDRDGNYTPFIAALSRELRARGRLLTVATASYEGGMVPVASVPYFDLVMPMSYDAIGPTWGQAGSEHATREQAARDVALWLARGVPRERLVLGVPFYGYGFGGHAPNHDFRALRAAHGAVTTTSDVIGAACAGCDYITFNSQATIRWKAELAAARAGGVMVWEMTQDTADQLLASTIAAALGLTSPELTTHGE
ncbi:MAG: hypothetical protein JNJ92_02430 [Altererythrobacter sp.]|nr:hypothetical protein [Altererythrobacter sp.]